ncbi:DUF1203 domain-containing protein [Streptomyces sp. NPDC002055]|uniref:DUF1203 domain-containing protein n=1 Tax=Streptomyces sp. NPDC002055 TaxID=3154534 RepID=UPI003316E86C
MTTSYEIRAIPRDVLRQLRDRDDSGNPPRLLTENAEGGNPLRCCFGRTEPGERIALVSYAPLRRWAAETGADPGPHNETGPVFIHIDDCGGPAGAGFPQALCGDRRVLRAYAADGRILGGRYKESDGSAPARSAGGRTALEKELEELYSDPEVAAVHLRAVEFGCFLLETRRREA